MSPVARIVEVEMKATPENKVKKDLKKYLDTVPNVFHYSATAGAYSTSGIPDIVGCYMGDFFAIEVKAPGRRKEANRGASALQALQMERIRYAEGFAMVFDGGEDDWAELKSFFEVGL
jgi:hypothetical protein